jgi:uncharacterized membrane protein
MYNRKIKILRRIIHMKKMNPTLRLVTAALLIAFTCIATMIIQIPTTATMGYIHIGDTFVILSGIILGPVLGGFAAGLGSLLADGLSGYAMFMIPTFIIKFTAALLCGLIYQRLKRKKIKQESLAFLPAALTSELIVLVGYFLNSIILAMVLNSSASSETIAAGFSTGTLGLLPNTVQGIVGIVLAFTLFPLLNKIPMIKEFIAYHISGDQL